MVMMDVDMDGEDSQRPLPTNDVDASERDDDEK